MGIKRVTVKDAYKFQEWVNIPYPQGYNGDNSAVWAVYRDYNPSLTCIIKFNLDRTQYSLWNTHPGDSTWEMDFYFKLF